MKLSPACWLAALALAAPQPPTRAEAPAQVQPSAGTVKEVRVSESYAPRSFGDYIDQGHDWLYRRMQYLIEDFDSWFAQDGVAPIVVPVSPMRIDFDGELLRNRGGLGLISARNFYASLQVPNLEHRLKVFITDDDLKESPVDPARKQNSVRLGLRLIPIPHLDVEAGVRTKIVPAAFGTARWAWDFGTGALRFYPFAKAYVETGSGLGISGGIAAEHWSGPWVFRSASYANWVRDTAATDWSQTLILGYARAVIQERRYDRLADGHDLACGLALKLAASGDRDSHSSQYEVSMVLKRPLHGGWLFGYFGPMVRWDRIYGWHPDVGVWVGFDALFWRLANDSAELATTCR